jgi:hypothetical protein
MKKDYWIRFGCFITGYNYRLLSESGEASKKSLKKFTAALLIISIIWAANGFNFANRYLDTGIFGSIIAAIIMIIVVIQIERQIILTVRPKFWLKFFRTFLAILMAFIGSVIIDQILFSKDLDELRNQNISDNKTLLDEYNYTKNYNSVRIQDKKLELQKIESNLNELTTKISQSGGNRTVSKGTIDTTTGKIIARTDISNDISPLISAQTALINEKDRVNKDIKDTKKQLELANLEYLQNKKSDSGGFFGEINLLIEFIKLKGAVTWVIYAFWLVFFFVLEILVLVAKSTDDLNDYERRVEYELDSNIKKIDYLANKSDTELKSS